MNKLSTQNQYHSGVSQAISSSKYSNLQSSANTPKFKIKIAETHLEKKKAYQLAYQSYLQKNYTAEDNGGILEEIYDTWQNTAICIAVDQHDHVIGTASVLYNHDNKLPCSELFDIDKIYDKKSTAELTRLAIDDQCKIGLQLLQEMYVFLYFYSKRNFNTNCFLIEVNPRHVMFYEKKLGFDKIKDGVPCPRVRGAIAVLLGTNFELFDSINKGKPIKNKKLKYIYNYYRNMNFSIATNEFSKTEKSLLSI